MQADGGVYEFAYTVNGSGQITQTDVTNPRGAGRRATFDASRYVSSDTRAFGQLEQQTTTYERQAGTNFVLATRRCAQSPDGVHV